MANETPSQTTANTVKNSRASTATLVGLFLALFGMLIIRQIFRIINPEPGTALTTLREVLYFACAGFLLWLVTHWETLPLTSIGLGTTAWWKSILWGLALMIPCLALAGILASLTHYGKAPTALDRLPMWLVIVIVFRAGIVEELFYRGYAIERLQAIGLGKPAAAILPLLLFAAAHYTGGAANILIALVLGGILTGFYLWRRDLVANIIAHVLVDLIGNVLGRLSK